MDLDEIVFELLSPTPDDRPMETASSHMSRQAWQEKIEELVTRLRNVYGRPAFGLSQVEISVYYHRPIEDLAILIRSKLR